MALDLTGQRFGRLTVIERAHLHRLPSGQGAWRWRCRCTCGNESFPISADLRNGSVRSCGCLRAEGNAKTHGLTSNGKRSPEYRSWEAMKRRCSNPKVTGFKRYGGRGIRVCSRWHSFENFLADMGPRPEGTTLDRFPDNDGNYEPGNVRWATRSEQGNNQSSTVFFEHDGLRLSVSDWARRLGIPIALLWQRIQRGWSFVDAITKPARAYRGRPGTRVSSQSLRP